MPELVAWSKAISTEWRVVVDGAALPRGARTLLVGYKPVSFASWPGTSSGDFLVDCELRAEGSVYRRLFNLARFRTVQIPCEAFSDCFVRVRDSNSNQFESRVVASSGRSHPGLVERVTLGQFLTPSTDVVTPFGSVQMTPAGGDAGFVWHVNGQNFARPLTAGVRVEVLGTSFDVTAVSNLLVWEIQL